VTSEPEARLGAFVAGYPAVVLSDLLTRYGPDQLARLEQAVRKGDLPESFVVEFVSTWRSIRAASLGWTAQQATGRRAAAADGTVSSRSTATPPGSMQEEADTDQAAAALHVTPNRVRQLCRSGALPGRKVGRAWLVAMDGVRRYRRVA